MKKITNLLLLFEAITFTSLPLVAYASSAKSPTNPDPTKPRKSLWEVYSNMQGKDMCIRVFHEPKSKENLIEEVKKSKFYKENIIYNNIQLINDLEIYDVRTKELISDEKINSSDYPALLLKGKFKLDNEVKNIEFIVIITEIDFELCTQYEIIKWNLEHNFGSVINYFLEDKQYPKLSKLLLKQMLLDFVFNRHREFAKKYSLEDLTFYNDGKMKIINNDNELKYGKTISVKLRIKTEVDNDEIIGEYFFVHFALPYHL